MKKIVLLLVLVLGIASLAFAETLIYANTLPQGKWGIEGIYLTDSNVSNISTISLNTYGVKVAYGFTDQLELDLAYAMGNYAGMTGTEVSMSPLTAALRYNLLSEANDLPATVTVAAGYKQIPFKIKVGAAETTQNWGKSGIALIASKMMIPFIPYIGLSYNTLSTPSVNVPSTELTIGTAIAWSKEGQVLVEYTSQSLTPDGGTNYTSPQIGVGVLYSFL